ncbi:Rossmann-like and DUF2520 domain-containing protein [Porphyromonas sp.]|uniref:Rossmann-like and DUF2520 domain-containing protein n=1 Tax=Porphyromonas sp. TaxID=1924944 RepID=UPI0026DC0BD6|nr:Rossmann-like and DUF2520 domain-containing protein [Porphyromonas sp.]MDO4771839.1 DUF2520 domain-containing protein [Porphyromonas sp.]
MNNHTFVIVGSGRVATHLSKALKAVGMRCVGVHSRTKENADTLARELRSKAIETIEGVWAVDTDFVLLAVSDNALLTLAKTIPENYLHVVLHTSGSTSADVLGKAKHHGVLYPLQTFSKERELKAAEIPFFLESSSPESKDMLLSIVSALGTRQTTWCDSASRRQIHLAAVFACNFVNHMYTLAYEVMETAKLDPSTLIPLMKETLAKLETMHPAEGQTGPASRCDTATMENHVKLLKAQPDLAKLYEEINRSIINKHTKRKDSQ